MHIFMKKKRKKALFTTITMPSVSILDQIPGRKTEIKDLDNVQDCITMANSESFLSGRIQPQTGIHFLKENIPSADILEYPKWEVYEQSLKRGYDIVGIGFHTTNFYDAVEMARMAKEVGTKEVWAGNFGALTPGTSEVFDRIFIGYAEKELKSVLENEVLENIKHPVLTTPFRVVSKNEKAGYLFTSRGCKFKCNFCSTPQFAPKPDRISIEEIEKILDIYKNMNINYINIADESFLQDRVHAKKVIELLHKKNMKWFCTTRADLILGHVEELKEKGFDSVYIGIESMKNANLTGHRKGESVDKIVAVLEEFKNNEVYAAGTYMLGLLHDTVSSIKEDLERLNELPLYILIFLVFTPFPELPIYKELKANGLIINNNWRDYDGYNMVFRHPYLTPKQTRQLYEYAVCNIYSPYNYKKRSLLLHMSKIQKNL